MRLNNFLVHLQPAAAYSLPLGLRMWPLLLAACFSVGYSCIPTESPDDRPNIPGVFPTTRTAPAAITSTTTISTNTPTTTSPTSTTTSCTTTTISTTTSSTTTTTTTTPDCPMGYTMFTDPTSMATSCYYVSPFPAAEAQRVNWATARMRCALAGGDLAVITTTTENDFVSGLANVGVPTVPYPDIYNEQVWIGGFCTAFCHYAENMPLNWKYLDGTSIDPTWALWIPNSVAQPDFNFNSCLSLLTNNNLFGPVIPTTGVGYWQDLDCNHLGRYACEILWPPAG